MDNEQNASLYVQVNALKLGYTVNYDLEKNMLDLISTNNSSHQIIGDIISDGNVVINLASKTNQTT